MACTQGGIFTPGNKAIYLLPRRENAVTSMMTLSTPRGPDAIIDIVDPLQSLWAYNMADYSKHIAPHFMNISLLKSIMTRGQPLAASQREQLWDLGSQVNQRQDSVCRIHIPRGGCAVGYFQGGSHIFTLQHYPTKVKEFADRWKISDRLQTMTFMRRILYEKIQEAHAEKLPHPDDLEAMIYEGHRFTQQQRALLSLRPKDKK